MGGTELLNWAASPKSLKRASASPLSIAANSSAPEPASMAWWDRMASPMRQVWAGVATRFGIRKSGLTRLRREVSTCEYEDVHVMWVLLTESGRAGPYGVATAAETAERRRMRSRRREESRVWAVLGWTRFGICTRF